MKKRFGLLGRTLGHSQSPSIFRKYISNDEYTYELCEIEQPRLNKELLLQFDGLNVTIPYKKDVIPYLDELDEVANEIQSVNCIENVNGHLIGHNTDYIGISNTLDVYVEWYKSRDDSRKALILGNGGVSATIQYYFKKHGIEYDIVSRDKSKGDITYQELSDVFNYAFIINATPVGMIPNNNDKPCIPYKTIDSKTVVFDLVYNPDPTLFLIECSKYTTYLCSGSKMLQDQAIASYKYWKIF